MTTERVLLLCFLINSGRFISFFDILEKPKPKNQSELGFGFVKILKKRQTARY